MRCPKCHRRDLKKALSKRMVPGTMVQLLPPPPGKIPVHDERGNVVGFTDSDSCTHTCYSPLPTRWYQTEPKEEIGYFTSYCDCGYIHDDYIDDGRSRLPFWPKGVTTIEF